MYVQTVAVGKDRLTHLPTMYGLREREREHMEARKATKELQPLSVCVCVSLVLLL